VLSYRHAFHAGNYADVVKHVVLVELLLALARKATPYCCVDTHAGAGWYDLGAAPASTHREHAEGIDRVWGNIAAAPAAVTRYLEIVRALDAAAAPGDDASGASGVSASPRLYPGSPSFIQACLRAHDRLIACELHPADYASLSAVVDADRRIDTRHADGYATLTAVLPPRERRGLVLMDPAYERADEIERLTRALQSALRRFAHGVYALWYPITRTVPIARLQAEITASVTRKVLRAELCVRPDDDPLGLNGSGLLIVNPPYRTAEALREIMAWLLPRLAPAGSGRTRVDWLVPE
jgi:23S rRNA (adenine2030-N6)-methyltransferase